MELYRKTPSKSEQRTHDRLKHGYLRDLFESELARRVVLSRADLLDAVPVAKRHASIIASANAALRNNIFFSPLYGFYALAKNPPSWAQLSFAHSYETGAVHAALAETYVGVTARDLWGRMSRTEAGATLTRDELSVALKWLRKAGIVFNQGQTWKLKPQGRGYPEMPLRVFRTGWKMPAPPALPPLAPPEPEDGDEVDIFS